MVVIIFCCTSCEEEWSIDQLDRKFDQVSKATGNIYHDGVCGECGGKEFQIWFMEPPQNLEMLLEA